MLDYEVGRSHLKFNTDTYDFYQMLLEHLSSISEARGGSKIESLEELHLAPGIQDNVEEYRQYCFSLFRTEEFQQLFKSFGKYLIDEYFDGVGLIQKTPTVRLQIPNATSTSYHSDGWYGHGESVRSFWLPLTQVGDGNTLYMADDIEKSKESMQRILSEKMSLNEINRACRDICSPFTGKFGDLLTFSSAMLHGAERNSWEQSRVSFDFRIAPDVNNLGTKPISNFFTYEELSGNGTSGSDTSNTMQIGSAITYSNLCNGKSAKAQLMLCSAYADANGISVTGNESEIVTLPYLPVLREYLTNRSDVDAVVVFGTEIFEGDRQKAAELLECAVEGNTGIVFCAEGVHYFPGDSAESVLRYIH